MNLETYSLEEALKMYSPPWWKPIWWKIERFYDYQIRYRLFPRQRWLTKQIPNEWCDKPELIADILFACIVNFVEEEKCFEVNSWHCTDEYFGYDRRKEKKIIEDCYRYAKLRKKLEEQVWKSRDNFSISIAMENLYNKCETHYCQKILEVRQYLWT
jgi:hypothetical protein